MTFSASASAQGLLATDLWLERIVDGAYWTGNGNSLYRRAPDGKRWELMADYSNASVGRFTRLAIDPECSRIAPVSDRL